MRLGMARKTARSPASEREQGLPYRRPQAVPESLSARVTSAGRKRRAHTAGVRAEASGRGIDYNRHQGEWVCTSSPVPVGVDDVVPRKAVAPDKRSPIADATAPRLAPATAHTQRSMPMARSALAIVSPPPFASARVVRGTAGALSLALRLQPRRRCYITLP